MIYIKRLGNLLFFCFWMFMGLVSCVAAIEAKPTRIDDSVGCSQFRDVDIHPCILRDDNI